jgi:hypothetical protein
VCVAVKELTAIFVGSVVTGVSSLVGSDSVDALPVLMPAPRGDRSIVDALTVALVVTVVLVEDEPVASLCCR